MLYLYYSIEKKLYVLAFRGTNLKSIPDWWTDIKQLVGMGGDLCENTQYERSYRITGDVLVEIAKTKKELVVVGHSLGGGIASYMAQRWGLRAFVYNTARSSWLTKSVVNKNGTINSYITYSPLSGFTDIVSAIGSPSPITKDYYLPTPLFGKITPKEVKFGTFIHKLLKIYFPAYQFSLQRILAGLKLHGRKNFYNAFSNVAINNNYTIPTTSIEGPYSIQRRNRTCPDGAPLFQKAGGLTPNTTATLFIEKVKSGKPVAIEKRLIQIDENGFWEENYKPTSEKPIGEYRWWIVDSSTGQKSQQLVYLIEGCNSEVITPSFNCKNIKSDTPKPLATAIVVDHSGSMADERKIDYARKATLAFPQYMKQNDLLSVSIFSSNGRTPNGLELQEQSTISSALHSILPTLAPDGQTNIGAGLESGLEQLCTVSGEKVKKGALLLSDGMNNVGEYNTVVQQYKKYHIPIYTVKFGNQASEKSLRAIATETDGIFMDSNQQTVAGVYSGIYDAINGNSIVASYHDHMSPKGKLAYMADVTRGATSLNINSSWQGSKLKTVFTSPSGSTFSGDQLPGQTDRFESGPITQFTQILNPEPGRWQIDISWDEPPTIAERVNLLISEHTDVYTSILGFSPEYTAGDTVTINVHASELDSGNNKIPLKNTRVTAKVQIPGPEIIRMILAQSSNLRVYNDVLQEITREIELFDDGEHNDYRKDDGIFGGFFTETGLNGSYIVTAHIEGRTSNNGYVDRHSTGSFQVGSLQEAEVTTSEIIRYARQLEERMKAKIVNPLGGMQSGSPSVPESGRTSGSKRKKRSRSLMDSLSN